MIEDFANWLKRKIFCNQDPVAEVEGSTGEIHQDKSKKPIKSNHVKALAKKVWQVQEQCTFEEWLARPANPPVRTDRSFTEWKAKFWQGKASLYREY
jgi:hypothetical protein